MALHIFQELYYMAHCDNLSSILEHGILSHAQIEQTGVARVDISEPGAQQWRARAEPVFGCAIHAYVPMYFNPRNPMLYVRRHLQHELVVLSISADAVKTAGQALFTDGNAACRDTRFSADFAVVEAAEPVLKGGYWSAFPDGRRMRCAEALVLHRVAPHFIERVACNNLELMQRLQQRHELQVEIEVDTSLFF